MSIETRRAPVLIFAKTARTAFKIILWLVCFALLGGCGIKGPLYLPQEKTATPEMAPVETVPAETTPAPESTTK